MSSIISILPDHVANQIAAGEVVQRPASVVKELLENSIDAGASRITLTLEGAGKTYLSVADNGSGMGAEDAELCFLRHATSKINSADDLFNLSTRGFRGEAMASIAAVAHVVLRSKNTENGLGLEIKMEDGKVVSKSPYPCEQGTYVEVKNLFYNVPARRKFLKNDRIELRHIIDEFHRVALVHTEIEWILKNEGNVLFHLKSDSLRKRINAIFGRKFDERLVPINETTDVVRISGFIIKPEFAKKKRGEQFFFVNNRFIKSPYLHNALREAYEEVLTAEHHPGYFLYLEVHPTTLDVNIHPTKTEVKFEHEQTIYALLRSAARHALGQFNVAPAIDFDSEISFSGPPLPAGKIPQAPKIHINPHFNPFESNQSPTPRFRSDEQKYERIQNEQYLNASPEHGIEDFQQELAEFWSTDEKEAPPLAQSSILRWDKFAITTLGSKALFIDIKAARFRIQYDQIWNKLKNATLPSQQLLFPVDLQLSLSEAALVEEFTEVLAVSGFDLNQGKNPGSFELVGIPMILDPEQAVPAFEALLEQLDQTDQQTENALLKTTALTLAKQAATSQLPKSTEELQLLKEQLLSSSNPQFSPSGKRIITEFTSADIEENS
jgi:DNA mismatch repair protein MutL